MGCRLCAPHRHVSDPVWGFVLLFFIEFLSLTHKAAHIYVAEMTQTLNNELIHSIRRKRVCSNSVDFTRGLFKAARLVHLSSTDCELAQLRGRVESVQLCVSQTAWRASADRMEFIPYVPGIPRMHGTETWPTERTGESAVERVRERERAGGQAAGMNLLSIIPLVFSKEIFSL